MLKTKVGYSVDSDSFNSGKESAKKAMEGYTNPKLGMVFCSCVYEESEVLKGVQTISGTLPIIGCTTAGAMIVPDGIIDNANGFSGMMLFDDEDLKVSVAGMERGNDPRETGRKIAIEAIKNAGTKVRPSYFYMVASPKEEEYYLDGIQDVIGRVPMFGGSCADNKLTGEWKILCNGEAFADGCAVAFFYTDKDIKTEYTGAYRETKDYGIITRVNDDRTLVEIDGLNSLEKYADWVGKNVEALKGNELLSASITSPIGVKDPLGKLTVVRHPMFGNDDNTMNIGNKLTEGTCVVRLESSVEELVESTRTTALELKKKLLSHPAGYVFIHCGGRKLGIGDSLEKVYDNLKSVVGTTPFITIFTFGEYGYTDNSANMCGGLMLSFTGFGE